MNEIDNVYKIRLIKNSKRPQREKWSSMKTKDKIDGNYGILTGYENNIIAIDIDFYDKKGNIFDRSKSDFLKQFGEDYITKFNTFTQSTPRGGFHLLFKYDADIKQTVNLEYNIDIRSDGGYVVGYDSIITDKKYSIALDTTIKFIPNALKTWLLSNLYSKAELMLIERKKKKKKIVYNEGIFKFINNTKLLIEIFDRLPDEYFCNHGIQKTGCRTWMDFTGFCKVFNCIKLWDKYSKEKCPSKYDKKQNKLLLDACSIKYNSFTKIFNEPSLDDIKHYKFYLRYKPLDTYRMKSFKDINVRKLGYTFLDKFRNDNLIIQSDTGTGKTTTFKHYIKKYNFKFISIVSRITLADEQYTQFNEFGVDCNHYQNIFNNKDNLIITIDSLLKLLKHNFDFENIVLFLDEFNSLIEHLLISDTLKSERVRIFEYLIILLKKCKQFICVDADISNISVKYAKYSNRKFKLIKNNFIHNKGIEAEELNNLDDLMNKIYDEDKYMVCCDTKKNAIYLYQMLDGKNDKKLILLTSDIDRYFCLDDYDKVIFSPKIIYGIDSTMKRPVFCYYKTKIISPTQMLQQISRTRNITKLYYYFENKYFEYCSYENIKDCRFINNNLYKLKEKYHGSYGINDITTQRYFDLYCLLDYNNDCYNSNVFLHFLILLEQRGFIIKEKYVAIGKISNNKKDLVKDYLNSNFDITSVKARNIVKLLHLPKENMDKYRNLFLNNKDLVSHFIICKYFFKTRTQLQNDLLLEDEMIIKKVKSEENKIIFLKKFQRLVKFKSEPYFKAKGLPENISDKYNDEYHLLFKKKKKVNEIDLTSSTQVIKINVAMLTSLFNVSNRSEIIDYNNHKFSFSEVFLYKLNTYHKELYEIRKNRKYSF